MAQPPATPVIRKRKASTSISSHFTPTGRVKKTRRVRFPLYSVDEARQRAIQRWGSVEDYTRIPDMSTGPMREALIQVQRAIKKHRDESESIETIKSLSSFLSLKFPPMRIAIRDDALDMLNEKGPEREHVQAILNARLALDPDKVYAAGLVHNALTVLSSVSIPFQPKSVVSPSQPPRTNLQRTSSGGYPYNTSSSSENDEYENEANTVLATPACSTPVTTGSSKTLEALRQVRSLLRQAHKGYTRADTRVARNRILEEQLQQILHLWLAVSSGRHTLCVSDCEPYIKRYGAQSLTGTEWQKAHQMTHEEQIYLLLDTIHDLIPNAKQIQLDLRFGSVHGWTQEAVLTSHTGPLLMELVNHRADPKQWSEKAILGLSERVLDDFYLSPLPIINNHEERELVAQAYVEYLTLLVRDVSPDTKKVRAIADRLRQAAASVQGSALLSATVQNDPTTTPYWKLINDTIGELDGVVTVLERGSKSL